MIKLYLYKCKTCDEYFIGRIMRHVMYYCPNKCSAVDLEDGYSRFIGSVKFIKEIRLKEE